MAFRPVVVLVSLGLWACNDNGFHTTNDASGSDPAIEVAPPHLDFGVFATGDEAITKTFSIKSVGESELDVESIEIVGAGQDSFTILTEETSFLLPSGATEDIEVAFVPAGGDVQEAQALIASNDPAFALVPVELQGSSATPQLEIEPDPLDLGTAYVGCIAQNTIDIRSVGSEPVTINDWTFDGDGIELVPLFDVPVTLAPGEFVQAEVTFTPLEDRDYASTLSVESTEPMGIRTADQLGLGAYAAEYTDSYELEESKVDLLFFVDQSGSMDDDARDLGANFQSFIDALGSVSNDWQIIVVNDDDGCNNSGILTPTSSNYQETFAAAVRQGGGLMTESGLTVASRAVENTDSGDCNAGFLRDDALLHIVYVSDEHEQSSGSWSTYVDAVIAKKGAESLVKMSAVAGDVPGGCGSAEAGTGYYDAVSATGGVFLSICSEWSTNVEDLADASIVKDTFALNHEPVEDTIEVTVNGSAATGWTYDAATNTIVFDDAHVPDEGTTIDIHYSGLATCD